MASPFLKKLSLASLFYVVLVILWGAFVRATGSGAGCGSHWPLCNGQVIPRNPEIQTLIELAHRVSSGLCLGVVGVLLYRIRRESSPRDPIRKAGLWSFILVITEALIGAIIVLYEWVAQDASFSRAISVSLHLVNTFLLLGALSATVFWAYAPARTRWLSYERSRDRFFLVGAVGLIFVGASGALTALGDTLFPVGRSVVMDHFLIRLRSFHPFLALGLGGFLIYLSARFHSPQSSDAVRQWSKILGFAVVTAMSVGGLTIFLKAPVALQIAHLLTADFVWISFVFFVFSNRVESRLG